MVNKDFDSGILYKTVFNHLVGMYKFLYYEEKYYYLTPNIKIVFNHNHPKKMTPDSISKLGTVYFF